MKALSKPLSSPGRAEKFPPPLMRFLRSNVGSRSRGRSRSSPMFYLRSKKSAAAAIETTQEPSSPKVTCIGQVRVRRSAKSKAKKTGGESVTRRRRHPCSWFKKALCCGKISPGCCGQKRPVERAFSKWGLCFGSGYCKKVDATEESFRVYSSNQKGERNGNIGRGNNSNRSSSSASETEVYRSRKYENLGFAGPVMKRDLLDSSVSSSPPKNALLLTRCRSAPYRSSSLGGRFWGSPLKGGDSEPENEAKSEELERFSCENVVEDSSSSQVSCKESESPGKNDKDLKGFAGGAVHPLLLTRCKSEPAGRGERLNPDANFLRQRRLGAVEPCAHHDS